MQLTEQDIKYIELWIREKSPSIKCFCCGTNQLKFLNDGTISIGFNVRTERFHYHQGIAQVGIVCVNCGYIMYFSAVIMGLKPEVSVQDSDNPVTESNK